MILTSVSQLSSALTLPSAIVPTSSHSTVTSLGTPLITGGVLSPTLIVCVAIALLPQSSVAVYVRTIVNDP